ncbi:hypothetical protein DFJ73DRAFT_879514 [Zopfochytrium polystomum]|nr:hypothetical protein DFJ73DRAFT_879514 [Zopfochytrium polystomum]
MNPFAAAAAAAARAAANAANAAVDPALAPLASSTSSNALSPSPTSTSTWREDGTPITGSDPRVTATTTPGLIAAESYETAIPTGLVLASFILMAAAALLGFLSLKATGAPWDEPPSYLTPEAAAAASDVAPEKEKAKRRRQTTTQSRRTPWVFRNPRWLPVLALSVLIDLYAYFSLLEFLFAGTWNKPFGYSPSYFLIASSYALVQARAYHKMFSAAPSPGRSGAEGIRLVVNCVLIVGGHATLTGNTSFTGVRTVIQFNGTYQYNEYSETTYVRPNYVYNRIYTSYSDGDSDLFSGPLWACIDYDQPPISNSTFNATSTTTLICQIRQKGFSQFLDWWAVFKFLALAYTAFTTMIADDEMALPDFLFSQAPMLGLALIELVAVFFRSVAAPPIYLELAWCPNTDFHWCQIMELGVLYPYSLRQTAMWASTLGISPVDKIAGYGAISA